MLATICYMKVKADSGSIALFILGYCEAYYDAIITRFSHLWGYLKLEGGDNYPRLILLFMGHFAHNAPSIRRYILCINLA